MKTDIVAFTENISVNLKYLPVIITSTSFSSVKPSLFVAMHLYFPELLYPISFKSKENAFLEIG